MTELSTSCYIEAYSLRVQEIVLGRRDRKKIEFHSNITNCAINLFRSRGYDATTVDGICHDLGISKATFFRYFPAKDAVLRDYLAKVTGDIESKAGEKAEGRTPSTQLREVFQQLDDFFAAEPEIAQALVVSGVLDPTRHPDLAKRFSPDESMAGRILVRAEAHGEFTCASTVTAVSLMLNSFVYSFVGWWVNEGRPAGRSLELVAAIETIIQGAWTTL
jgi:TetR/AcrR family transcriptional regulator, cholesterol catabolism regulator